MQFGNGQGQLVCLDEDLDGHCLSAGDDWPLPPVWGLHNRRGSSAIQRDALPTLEVVRVPGNFEGRLHCGAVISHHHSRLNRSLLYRDSAVVRHVALRQGWGPELPRSILYYRDHLHSLVYRRSDRAIRVVSGEAAILEGLQERGWRDGDRSVLRDAVQRSVYDELLQRQVERVTRLSPCYPSHSHLQVNKTLGRTSGERSWTVFTNFVRWLTLSVK